MQQGLIITFWGLLLTFATLGIMVLPIALLLKIFPAKEPKPEEAAPVAEEPAPCLNPAEGNEAEVAAAIAIRILAERRQENSAAKLGETLEGGPGRWWTSVD
jgi:Na+-transporting methylmalonyl-CoA/oxaloacetate decarboxylase gamma subunit